MDLEVTLLFAVFFIVAALMMGMIWTLHRATLLPSDLPTGLDPIMGKRDRTAIHDSYEPHIPMPDDLRTKEQMVAWMTKELPKLTEEFVKPRQ